MSGDQRDPSHNIIFAANDNGRNASASLNSVTVGSYLYNGFEQRAQKIAGAATIQFVYDQSGHLLEEANSSGAVQREYIWLDDMPVAMVDDTGTSPVLYYIHTDQLGTPQKITDGSLNVVWDGAFDPFGNPVSGGIGSATWGSVQWGSFNWGATGPSLSLTNLRFPGQYFDAETSLNQNWNREYDPSIGRYIQSDPIGLNGGVNKYAYVQGNPLGLSDSAGLQSANVVCSDVPNCEKQYQTETEVCNQVTKRRGAAAGARCHASASDRFAACLRGKPLPPFDVWNNRSVLPPQPKPVIPIVPVDPVPPLPGLTMPGMGPVFEPVPL